MTLSWFLYIIVDIMNKFNSLNLISNLPLPLLIFYIALLIIVVWGIKELMRNG